ncbi:MAG: IS3 family transposase [Planctomycetota bacterium]
MNRIMTPLSLLITAMAARLNEHQAKTIDFLIEEIEVYQEIVGTGRLPLTDDQRRRLAIKGKAVGRKRLKDLPTIMKPDTILGWFRRMVARKHDHSAKRGPGRPRTAVDIRQLIIRMAEENPTWGYTRIMGALTNLGHTVGRTTIAEILEEHGLVPAPERGKKTRWRDFLRAHWDVIGATDFFSVEVWTAKGLVTFYVLFFIEVSSRRVEIAGFTPHPNEASWRRSLET